MLESFSWLALKQVKIRLHHRGWLILAEIPFQRFDEKNTRKTSVLRESLPGGYVIKQNTQYFVEFFRAVFKYTQDKARADFLKKVYIDVLDRRKT